MSSFRTPRSDLDMMECGRDIHGVDRNRLAIKRRKRGECGRCGTRLYATSGFLNRKHKTPLTIPGQVVEGRCLICHPLDERERQRSLQRQQETSPPTSPPRQVVTPVSALRVPNVLEVRQQQQEVSPPRQVLPASSPRHPVPQHVLEVEDDATVVSAITVEHNFASGRMYDEEDEESLCSIPPLQNQRPGPSASGSELELDARPMLPRRTREQLHPPSRRLLSRSEESEKPPLPMHDRPPVPVRPQSNFYENRSDRPRDDSTFGSCCGEDVDFFPDVDSPIKSPGKSPPKHRRPDTTYLATLTDPPCYQPEEEDDEDNHNTPASAARQQQQSNDVSLMLTQLEKTTGSKRADVLHSLTACLWDDFGTAKQTFAEANGVETLATILWTDMTKPPVVRATASLLLALTDGILTHDNNSTATEGLLDALLIAMGTLQQDQLVQQRGCQVLACLAQSSARTDGSRQGAVSAVVRAMDALENELGEWGIRALYNQCYYSTNAEPNKRALAADPRARAVLANIFRNHTPQSFEVEWCSRLYWLLSASADVAELLAPSEELLHDIKCVLHDLHRSEGMVIVQEALLGTLVNFGDDPELVHVVLDTLAFYDYPVDILHQACLLLTVVGGRQLDDAEGYVPIIMRAMRNFRDDGDFLETALRALLTLSLGSTEAKDALLESLSFLIQLSTAMTYHELCCALVASIFCSERRLATQEVVDYLCSVMTEFPDSERLQDAGCCAIRNLSCVPQNASLLVRTVRIVMDDLRNFPDATTIHSNACCALWNLRIYLDDDDHDQLMLTGEDIQCIVTTLQNHLEDKQVVHMACGALCSNVHGSEERKRALLETDGGLDAIACVLVMHPDSEAILETVCGIFTSLTIQHDMVQDVAQTEGFHNMVDVMRSGSVLKSGSRFLLNTCLVFPEFADEAASVVPAIVQGMKSHLRDAAFQRETCSLLWLVAAQSSDAKSKILALDGVALLMSILESYSGVEQVEEVALGAFRELALSSPG
jgi:hypothetical protein